MKLLAFILIGGLLLGAIGYTCTYSATTATQRAMQNCDQPELAWLKQEYQLSDQQYTNICKAYADYHPKCLEMCREIDAQNEHLEMLLAQTNAVTPEIKQALADLGQLRAKCQANMLAHFYAVSQAMPPEQGRRYLAWVQAETLVPSPMANDQTTNQLSVP